MMQVSDTSIFPDRPPAYAGFWERFAAAFIDGLITGAIVLLLRLVSGVPFFEPSTSHSLLSIVIGWLYYAVQESGRNQATVGKRALSIMVTTTHGGRISFGQATGRYFGKWISALIIFIGYLIMLWDDKRQTLHDKMAGTLVIKSS